MNQTFRRTGAIAVAACTALFFIFCAWMATFLVYNQEDLIHFDANSLIEGCTLAIHAYEQYNPRIGEMLMYVQGAAMDNPLLWFQIVNPICLCMLVHFCFRLGVGRWAGGQRGDVLSLLFCIFSILSIHSGIYWYAGNMSWLYPCTIAAGLMIAMERIFRGDFSFSLGQVLGMLPLVVVTGMSNNNTSVVATMLICASWPWAMLKQRRWIWPSVGFCVLALALVASFFCYYLAPGNAGRMAMADWELSFSCWRNRSILVAGNWIYALICFLCPMLSLFVLLGITLLTKRISVLRNRRLLMLGMVGFMLWSVLTLAPAWGMPRALLPIHVVFACLLAAMVNALVSSQVKKGWIAVALAFHMALALLIIIPNSSKVIYDGKLLDEIRRQACAAAAAGQKELVLEAKDFPTTWVMQSMTWAPKSICRHTQSVTIPIRIVKRSDYQAGRIHHQWGTFSYAEEEATYVHEAQNTWLAKPCGLEAIYCLED